ncbi:MAG: hypothetical protein AB1585_19190, partial [Thermodesulfobacteriota bacterium]
MADIFDRIGSGQQDGDEDVFDQIGVSAPKTPQTEPGFVEGMTRPYVRGFQKAVAGSNKLVANIAGLFEYAGNKVADLTGLPRGMAATAVKDWAEKNVRDWTPEALENQGMVEQIIEGTTEGVLRLPEYAGFVKYLGPVGGFAAHGALSEADKGLGAAAMGAARGGLTGSLFEVTKPLAPVARALAVGGPTAAATAIEGGDVGETISSGVTMGLMAGMGQRGGLKIRDAFKKSKGREAREAEGLETQSARREAEGVRRENEAPPIIEPFDRPWTEEGPRPDLPIPPGPPPPRMGPAGEAGPPPPVPPRPSPAQPSIMTDVYQNEAQRLGLTFNGLQARWNYDHKNGIYNQIEPLALFTDPETGSTFAIKPGQDIAKAREQSRGRFPKDEPASRVLPQTVEGRDVFDEIFEPRAAALRDASLEAGGLRLEAGETPIRERVAVEADIRDGKGVPFEELRAYPDLARGKEEAPIIAQGVRREAEGERSASLEGGGGRPGPGKIQQPKTLTAWIKSKGGIWDESLPGETRQFIGKESGFVGLVSKKNGKALDELAALAKDDGWLPAEAGSRDLLELLDQDMRSMKQGKPRVVSLRNDLHTQTAPHS